MTQIDPEFTEALDRHIAAIARRNIEDFASTVCDDVCLVGTDGRVTQGAAAAIAAHRAWFEDSDWQFEVVERRIAQSRGDVGWAFILVEYRAMSAATYFNLFLLFTRASDGRWRLAYDQGTTVAS